MCTHAQFVFEAKSASGAGTSEAVIRLAPRRRGLASLTVLHNGAMKAIEDYVASLGLNAYLVGGAVRDELLGRDSKDADFLVLGVDSDGLRAALAPHGRVEELVVAGSVVGMRLFPRDRSIRVLAPAGIELAPPRHERSTGPGRHDFEIVVDANGTVEDDLRRRDFTINAIARRLADGTLVDPYGGRDDLRDGVLRTVSERSFAEDPLRLVRGLRFVSQLDLDPDEQTLARMREQAGAVALVSGERIGGGLGADGMGELSKLLLGQEPRKALRLARDTGVLVAVLPEFGPAVGFHQGTPYHELTLDEHLFHTVQLTADAGRPLPVRLAALLHDLGKPLVAWRDAGGSLHFYAKPQRAARDHAEVGAELAGGVLRRLRYPNDLRRRVVAIVRNHMFELDRADALRARRLLARYGEELTLDLLDHKEADLAGKGPGGPLDPEGLDRLRTFRTTVEEQLTSPHRLADLAVDGRDLIRLGYEPGPELGRTLDELLGEVVDTPALNSRELLLARAEELLRR
jgi:tRNA nucleotidyltransferase (CCA-adding enzyme)